MVILMNFCGIDIGLTGAVALEHSTGQLQLFDLNSPVEFFEVGNLLATMFDDSPTHVMVEAPSSRPGNAKQSDLKTWFNAGQIIGSLRSCGYHPTIIDAKAWQKPLMIKASSRNKKEHKLEIAEHAKKHFPKAKIFGPRGGLKDGRSDALMILKFLKDRIGENEST